MDKINVSQIIRDHYATFVRYPDDKLLVTDWLVFLGVPAATAALFIWLAGPIKSTGALLASVSILAGLLFALLILILELAVSAADRAEEGQHVRTGLWLSVLGQIRANVAYSVLVSLGTTVLLGGAGLVERGSPSTDHALWFSAFVVFLLGHLALTMLMVLKRVYFLLSTEVDRASSVH